MYTLRYERYARMYTPGYVACTRVTPLGMWHVPVLHPEVRSGMPVCTPEVRSGMPVCTPVGMVGMPVYTVGYGGYARIHRGYGRYTRVYTPPGYVGRYTTPGIPPPCLPGYTSLLPYHMLTVVRWCSAARCGTTKPWALILD